MVARHHIIPRAARQQRRIYAAFQQALSIGVGLAAAIGLRMIAHWWLTRLRD
jgi:hypothetical protein